MLDRLYGRAIPRGLPASHFSRAVSARLISTMIANTDAACHLASAGRIIEGYDRAPYTPERMIFSVMKRCAAHQGNATGVLLGLAARASWPLFHYRPGKCRAGTAGSLGRPIARHFEDDNTDNFTSAACMRIAHTVSHIGHAFTCTCL